MARIVLAGYLVRYPVGGYAWQAAHYLLGLRALGHDVWFYEDNGYYAPAYNPLTKEMNTVYDYGIAATAAFLDQVGYGDQWVFVDKERQTEHGPGSGKAATLLREADLLINLGGVNRFFPEQRTGRLSLYIDIDPVYTQLQVTNGNDFLRAMLDEYECLFTFGENIGTSRSPVPVGGRTWHPTRQPVILEFWSGRDLPIAPYTTIGRWNAEGRTLVYQGETFTWCKRTEWLRFLDLPARAGMNFEIAMDVGSVPGDPELLAAHGWRVVDPLKVSVDPWAYRDYLCGSRGEFTVAKDMNIRLRSGWFSDRAACYLAAGRPVIEQDTGFGDILPVGPGLHAFRTCEEAAEAIRVIETDYDRASAYATEIAREYFAADRILAQLLRVVGL